MNLAFATHPLRAAVLVAATAALAGCSSFDTLVSGEKVDYRGQAQRSQPMLEVPPDLTQLAREGRYVAPSASGTVSASTLRQGSLAPAAGTPQPGVAASSVGEVRVVRDGNLRYLVTSIPPEKLFPQVRGFWQERGFSLAIDNPEIGLLETDWAENRAKLPQDIVRRTLGRVLESFYSTSERDRYRTRIERTATGSEIYISHKGMQEVYINEGKDITTWQPRPADPELEIEFLSRLMVSLGGAKDTEAARSAVAATPSAAPAAAARKPAGLPATASFELNEPFDRAWRAVGLALDRSGFTVEDRDRSAGLYFVRYVDPKLAGKEEPNFFSKLFSSGSADQRPTRMRVQLKTQAGKTVVSMQNGEGAPDNSVPARTVIGKLIESIN